MTEPAIARTAPAGAWRQATVREVIRPGSDGGSARAVRLLLDIPDRIAHLPGQHYVIRLTAEDGYIAQRSYSVASAPHQSGVELYVERLEDGEVSGFLADVVIPGDLLEVRGPIGGWFVWRGDTPALLIGGGSGVVPLISMVRHARHLDRMDLLRIAVSARTPGDLPYFHEMVAAGATIALTRSIDPAVARTTGRLAGSDLEALIVPGSTVFVCGSAGFAEAASLLAVAAGVVPEAMRVERFGPSGP